MSKTLNSVTATIGVVGALALGPVQADVNPFGLKELDSGYKQLAIYCGEDKGTEEGKCGEGKCGEGK